MPSAQTHNAIVAAAQRALGRAQNRLSCAEDALVDALCRLDDDKPIGPAVDRALMDLGKLAEQIDSAKALALRLRKAV